MVVLSAALSAGDARAAGGQGGGFPAQSGGAGGEGNAVGRGRSGNPGDGNFGGGGGGAGLTSGAGGISDSGGGGGQGGSHGLAVLSGWSVPGDIAGNDGNAGVSPAGDDLAGGGGGEGGYGIVASHAAGGITATVDFNVSGGTGGAGGVTTVTALSRGTGGGGGDGGHGLFLVTPGYDLTIAGGAIVRGGTGGIGGGTVLASGKAGNGGKGGAGGAGIVASSGAGILVQPGATVAGGDGGAGGAGGGTGGLPGANGQGGAGILGAGLHIRNAGTIQGGVIGGGALPSPAIDLTGGSNSLTLERDDGTDGLTGDVRLANEAQLSLSVSASAAEVALDSAITGSGSVVVDGPGTLTLAGANTYTRGTTLKGGVTRIGQSANLGDSSTGLVLDGGTLQVSANLAMPRDITVDAGGGTLSTLGGGALTLSGVLSGDGDLAIVSPTVDGGSPAEMTNVMLTGNGAAYAGRITVLGEAADGSRGVANLQVVGTSTQPVVLAGDLASEGLVQFLYADISRMGRIDNDDFMVFDRNTTAGDTAIRNRGKMVFQQNSSAGQAELVADGSLAPADNFVIFLDSSTGGNATITAVDGGQVIFDGNSTPGSAALVAEDGAFDFSTALGPAGDGILPVAALSGSRDGTVYMGGNTLRVGNGQSTEFAGTLTDDCGCGPAGGRLVKTGSGTLTLSGPNSYTGGTEVEAGELAVEGPGIVTGSVQVRSGATLSGTGTVAAAAPASAAGVVMIDDGGILSPGDAGGAGTLTVAGSLQLDPGAVLDYRLGAPAAAAGSAASGVSDLIAVAGDLRLGGTLNLSQSPLADDGAAAFGYYRLFTYGGSLSGAGLALGSVPTPLSTSELTVLAPAGAGHVDLRVATGGDDAQQTWTGGDGVWDAAGDRWRNQYTGIVQAWAGQHAIFEGAGATVQVQGALPFESLQFVDGAYRLAGTGELRPDGAAEIRVLAGERAEIATAVAGTGSLVKTEGGRLVLSGANGYQGGTRLAGGVLEVERDENLGAAAGGLTFAGGTLATTADLRTARAVALAGDGGFDVAGGTTLQLDGAVSGAGDLHKRGAGTLRLAGANGYGNTVVEAGTLVGSAASIRGDVASDGTVVFEQAGDATFRGDIAAWRDASGGATKRGAGTLTLAGASSLAWRIEAGRLASAAGRYAGDAWIGAGASLAFDQAQDGSYAGRLSGPGSFDKSGAGAAYFIGDGSGFTGTTTVRQGLLSVGTPGHDASLGGTVRVLDGGALGGSGRVGSVVLGKGATVAPGNSIGTLNVAGDLDFDAGSVYEVEVDPAGSASDRIEAGGRVALNGAAVRHVGLDGGYRPSSTYTIVQAAGGVDGRFGSVASDYVFLRPDLSYDANHVYLQLTRNDTGFDDLALTANQRATAAGAESAGAGSPVYGAIATQTGDAASLRALYDQLSGEIHASVGSALSEDSRHPRDAALGRLRAAFGQAGGSDAPVTTYGPGGPQAAEADTRRVAAWGQAYGAWGSSDGDADAGSAKLDRSAGGLFVGADARIGGNWRAGLMAGYGNTSLEAHARASKADVDSYTVGAYAGGRAGPVNLRLGAAHSWHETDTRRSIAEPGLAGTARADYRGRTAQVFGEAGYPLQAGRVAVEPYAGLAYVNLRTGGYDESGPAGLHAGSRSDETTYTTLGARASAQFELGRVQAAVRGALGWRHALGDVNLQARHAFAGGAAFDVAGAPIARNAAVVEAGVDMQVGRGTTVGLAYQGQAGDGMRQHGVGANVTVRF